MYTEPVLQIGQRLRLPDFREDLLHSVTQEAQLQAEAVQPIQEAPQLPAEHHRQ